MKINIGRIVYDITKQPDDKWQISDMAGNKCLIEDSTLMFYIRSKRTHLIADYLRTEMKR